jgi:hypothetical protein
MIPTGGLMAKPRPVSVLPIAVEDYAEQPLPLGGYLTLMGVYAAAFTGLMYLSTHNGRVLRQPRGLDLALIAIGSYKFSRIVTMSFIFSPIRAPFTTRGKSLHAGEVQDVARGEGLQRAIGSLLTCPFCFSMWSTTAFAFGYTLAPRTTRQAASILSIAAADDFLHLAFRNFREASL